MRGLLLGCGLALLTLAGAGAQSERMRAIDPIGGEWIPVRIGAAAFPAIPHARVFFHSDSYSTQAGCGNFGGRYTLDGPRIRTSHAEPVQVGKCAKPSYARWERALAGVMARASTYALLPDGALRITTRTGEPALFRRPTPAVPALAGRWRVERIGTEAIARGRSVRVDFAGDSVSAGADCNSMGAQVRAERGGFRVEGGAATQMGCGAVKEAFDDRLFSAVTKARRFVVLSGDRVRLEGGAEPLVLRRFRLEPSRQALPGTYQVCGSNPRGVYYDGVATVTFDGAQVSDDTGCRGAYTTRGAELSVRLAPSRACSAAPAPAEGDVAVGGTASVLAVLRPDGYAFDEEGRLRLRTRRGLLDLCRQGDLRSGR